MSEDRPEVSLRDHALSFGGVADVYDRARPSYPAEAVDWLLGSPTAPLTVLELGAGTGKLTGILVEAGHRVVATDPSAGMLQVLRGQVPGAIAVAAPAEAIPIPSRSIDVVIAAQAFHWFDHARALPEIARVLRPGGTLALVWNSRDEGVPWVRKLGALIGGGDRGDLTALTNPAEDSAYFGPVVSEEFRFWQQVRRPDLLDLVRSRSYVAVLPTAERDDLLARVGTLYDDYGRGPDGMRLPYLTQCHRVEVVNQPPPPVVLEPMVHDDHEAVELVNGPENTGGLMPGATRAIVRTQPPVDREDTGTLLIDFS
jgi:SAM-dependent methyltransferase